MKVQAYRPKTLLSVISHDLSNPLTALSAASEKLSGNIEKLQPKQILIFAGVINRNSRNILNQLNELVDRVKEQHGKSNFNPQNNNVHNNVEKSFNLLSENADQKSII